MKWENLPRVLAAVTAVTSSVWPRGGGAGRTPLNLPEARTLRRKAPDQLDGLHREQAGPPLPRPHGFVLVQKLRLTSTPRFSEVRDTGRHLQNGKRWPQWQRKVSDQEGTYDRDTQTANYIDKAFTVLKKKSHGGNKKDPNQNHRVSPLLSHRRAQGFVSARWKHLLTNLRWKCRSRESPEKHFQCLFTTVYQVLSEVHWVLM